MDGGTSGRGCALRLSFKNPDQVPYPDPPPPIQNPTNAKDEETKSMRELVQAIDSHVELIDLEITSDPNVVQSAIQQLPNPTTQSLVNVDPILLDQLQDPTT